LKTTQLPKYDLEKLFPKIKELLKITTRLHPRQAKKIGLTDSKFGGDIIWPKNEYWPMCSEPIYSFDKIQNTPHNEKFITVLQLNAKDIKNMDFPANKDLFQLLWCPADHPISDYSPILKGFWRNAKDITDLKTSFPESGEPNDNYLITECSIFPEIVYEYPSAFELETIDKELSKAIFGWESTFTEPIYQHQLSVADGCKVGGYIYWHQDPNVPICKCGKFMEHLLTISDTEFDGGSYKRWCPIEDNENIMSLPYPERKKIQNPLNINFGMGKIYVFVCKDCHDWPIESVYQR